MSGVDCWLEILLLCGRVALSINRYPQFLRKCLGGGSAQRGQGWREGACRLAAIVENARDWCSPLRASSDLHAKTFVAFPCFQIQTPDSTLHQKGSDQQSRNGQDINLSPRWTKRDIWEFDQLITVSTSLVHASNCNSIVLLVPDYFST
ncbi:hypothetical protein V8F06_005096 [Rhypophila decipiens]